MPPKPSRKFLETMATHRRTLDRLLDRRAIRGMEALYNKAQDDLSRKLSRLIRTGRGDTMTAYQVAQLRAQVREGQARIAAVMAAGMKPISQDTAADAIRQAARTIRQLEKEFSGAELVLPVEEAATFQGLIAGRMPSLVRVHQTSFARYGARLTQQMEDQLSLALVTGETPIQAIDRVMQVAGNEWWQAERIVRTECLLGDAFVDAAMVTAVHRRWYEGPVVEIVTERGRKFTATPNHPMLTRRAWVGAGALREGDDLVRHLGQEHASSARHKDVAACPATIREIFDSVAAVGVRERRRTAQPDFHGDGLEGEVDIFRPDRVLAVGRFAPVTQPIAQQMFAPTDLRRTAFCAVCGNLLSMQKQPCGCGASKGYTSITKALLDEPVADLEVLREGVRAFASEIPTHDLIVWDVNTQAWVNASSLVKGMPRARQIARDASLANDAHHPSHRDAHLLGNSGAGLSSQVEFDRVVSVVTRQFCGHVFNLSTAHGYFAVNGVYTGNTAYAFNAAHSDAIVAAQEELPDLYERWTEYVDDRTGKPLDDRVANDSLVLHGQVVAKGGQFIMPPDSRVSAKVWNKRYDHPPNRPNDRAVLTPWRPHWRDVPAWEYRNGERVSLTK